MRWLARLGELAATLRHPRSTVRGRLMLLISAVLFASGALLLAITYAQVAHRGSVSVVEASPVHTPESGLLLAGVPRGRGRRSSNASTYWISTRSWAPQASHLRSWRSSHSCSGGSSRGASCARCEP